MVRINYSLEFWDKRTKTWFSFTTDGNTCLFGTADNANKFVKSKYKARHRDKAYRILEHKTITTFYDR